MKFFYLKAASAWEKRTTQEGTGVLDLPAQGLREKLVGVNLGVWI